jgi:hypothetical protein
MSFPEPALLVGHTQPEHTQPEIRFFPNWLRYKGTKEDGVGSSAVLTGRRELPHQRPPLLLALSIMSQCPKRLFESQSMGRSTFDLERNADHKTEPRAR